MTDNRKRLRLSAVLSSITPSSFHVEIKKSTRGAIAVISGVVSVAEYTDSSIELLSHSGRMNIYGDSLGITVLEGRVIEIFGRIAEVKFGYGKS